MAVQHLRLVLIVLLFAIAQRAVGQMQNRVGFQQSAYTVSEGQNPSEICVILMDTDSDTLVLDVQIMAQSTETPDTANPADYTTSPNLVTFTVGSAVMSQQCITVTVVDDSITEPTESFFLSLSPAQGNVTIDSNLGMTTVNIIDNDALALQQPSYTVDEGAGSVAVCAEADGVQPGETITVSYSTTNGVAIAGQDYTAVSGTFTFLPNTLVQCVSIPITNDGDTEPDECFNFNIFNPNPSVQITLSTAQVCIQDNDQTIVIGLNGQSFFVEEGGVQPVCVGIISGSTAGRTFSISYTTVDGAATSPADFGTESGTFTFSDTAPTQQCLFIDAVADGLDEDTECLSVQISTPTPSSSLVLSPSIATVCIDDAATVTIQQPSYTVDEGDGFAVVCAEADGVDPGETITVSYSTTNGAATAGQDYTAVSGTFTFNSNNLLRCVNIPILDDTVTENEECFTFNIFNPNPSSVQITRSSAPVCIEESDQAIVIGLIGGPFSVEEGDVQTVCVGIISGSTAGRTFSISYTTVNGAATSPADFGFQSGTFTFSDTAPTQQCLFIQTVADGLNENIECFSVQISSTPSSSLVLSPSTAAVCIDDEETVGIQDPSYSVNEEAGTVTVCAVAEVVDPGEVITVQYFTSDGAAVAGQDYVSTSGTFSFSPNNLIQCATITILDDTPSEGEECFNFNIASPVPSTTVLTRSSAPVCILDDDRIIGFVEPEYTVPENVGMGNFEVCIEIINGQVRLGEVITVSITLLPGDAIEGEDYDQVSPSPFPLQFNQANMNQQLCATVNIIDDLVLEPIESFFATLQPLSTSPGVTLAPSLATIIIIDDEEPGVGPAGPMIGDDPHFAIFLPSGKLLCYTVQGEHDFTFNLISNENVQMNARFVPDSRREEVTWIGSLGIVVKNTRYQGLNTTKIRFDSKVNLIHINDKVTLEAKNIDVITFRDGKLLISEGPMIERFHYPSVRVNLDDHGMKFTVNFTGEHLDMMWNSIVGNTHSHGLIGQFFRKGVEIDTARKLLLLPDKDPVPVMRKPVWAYMEHNVPSDQLCWVAMNPGYQGHHLIDGHYLDYVVEDVLSTNFEFKCKHK